MSRDLYRLIVLGTSSVAIGWIAWTGSPLALPASALFPVTWSAARSRRQAAGVSAGYFLAASRGLPQGVANYYSSDVWPGLMLWLIASAAFVAVHSMLWTSRAGWRRPLGYLVACLLMSIPPFGITGWAHPITAAGILLPGWGWSGLVAMAAGLAFMTTRHWPAAAIALAGLWLWSAAGWTAPNLAASWHGVDLEMGASLGRDPSLERQEALFQSIQGNAPGTTVVLPESALGFWTPTLARFWQDKLTGTGIGVVAGAAIMQHHGYDNVLVNVSSDSSKVLYRERMPVPGSMWQPWTNLMGDGDGAQAHFFANPVVQIGGDTVAPLICYEQLIIWPVLQSMLHQPDVIVAVGNDWWTAGTSIVEIQRASAQAWARLFDVPLVMAFNT